MVEANKSSLVGEGQNEVGEDKDVVNVDINESVADDESGDAFGNLESGKKEKVRDDVVSIYKKIPKN